MVIGITDCLREDKFQKYVDWIRGVAPDAQVVKLSPLEKNANDLAREDGLLFTGGGDVHPKFYGMESHLPDTQGVDEARDTFEFDLIDKALDSDLPILAVCRGMQVLNVYLGGTLHVDLSKEGFNNHLSSGNRVTRHSLSVVPHSMLHAVNGSTMAEVNSYHHQAVDRLGNGLVTTSISEDGVVESVEWALKEGMPFLAGVQWHPEREKESLLSRTLAQLFVREVQHSITTNTLS
jgi:putative glutamine amidotransferase